MANTSVAKKNSGDSLTSVEFNDLLDAINSKMERNALKAFRVTGRNSFSVGHNFERDEKLLLGSYYLKVDVYEDSKAPVGGFVVEEVTGDITRISFLDTSYSLIGYVVVSAIVLI